VLALITVKGGFGIGAGVLVLLLIFSKRVFHAGAVGYGILLGARGLGALIGPFIGKWLAGPDDRRLFTVIGLSLAVFGTSYALFGVMPVIWLAAIAVGVAHLGGGAQWTLSSYGLQRIVPDHIRGRVFAFDGAMITITLAVSSPLTGFMAEHVGPRPTAVGLGVIAPAWAATWTWLTTDVRRRGIYGGPGGREGGTPPA
jgi:MFS family permease